jgi:hypothetical protein
MKNSDKGQLYIRLWLIALVIFIAVKKVIFAG